MNIGRSGVQKNLIKTCALLIALLSLNTLTIASVLIGEVIPPITIKDTGELVLNGNEIHYKSWNTETLKNKAHILLYQAGRMSASIINKPLTDLLDTLKLPPEHHQITSIVNLNDTFFGTYDFVHRELKKNKLNYPNVRIVADKNGDGAIRWQLKRESSAIFVVSASGKVLFFKDGALTRLEIQKVVTLIKEQIQLLKK